MSSLNSAKVMKTAQDFLGFINKSPSPFQAVAESIAILKKAGFQELQEVENWDSKIVPGGKYYVHRNQSSLITFAVGEKFKSGNGFNIIGAHTDSPCLKIKPISQLESQGWLQVGVECYGGGLFHTWFDRDLGIAGRVFVKDGENGFRSRLLMVNKPIMRVPTLAIHLDREAGKGIQFNKETQLRPVLASSVKANLEACAGPTDEEKKMCHIKSKHHSLLLQLIAKELSVEIDDICDFELSLFDTQGANVGGIMNEFIFSPRLDNLCCTWLSLEALVASLPTLKDETNVRVVALFDHEEVGSHSLMGAASNFLQLCIERVSNQKCYAELARKSLFVSADMAHAVHPNYSDKHEQNHKPKLHLGPVIKYNANQRYATTSETAFILKELGKRHSIPLQEFVVRQDVGCGSTIGPILSTNTGIRTIDVGVAQLSMHSIRELCGTDDLELTREWFTAFFNEFTELDRSVKFD